MSKSRDIADSAATINYIDNVTSDVQSQLNTLTTAIDNVSVTSGTLTKTFTTGESSTINLTSSVLAPVVSVTKEVPQSGVTNNNWDVNSTTENYTRLNSAYATTLDWVGDLASASFVDSFSVSSQETSPQSVAFNNDGSKMYIVGTSSDAVNEYNLSTAFDVSTSSYSQNFSVASQDTVPTGLAFNNDGTKMYVLGLVGDDVNEYTLSTGFDVSTASYSQNFSVASQDTECFGIAFNSNGTKMFITGQVNDSVYEYTLSTAFDVSTASYVQAFSVASQDTAPRAIYFNNSGTLMYLVGFSGADVNEYTLSTAFDISTATYNQNFSVSAQESSPNGISFNNDFTKMFIVGESGDDVNEYNLPLALALGTGSFASADVGKTIEANDGVFVLTATDGSYVETTAPTSYDQVASGSWEMYGVVYNAADGDLQLSGQESFDISTAAFVNSFSVASQDEQPRDVTFNTDGTKMFIVGSVGDSVYEYALSTGFDVSTASYTQSFSVSAQETSPVGISFNSDGTKMFIVGQTGDDVNEYTLSAGFNVATASFVDSFSVSGQDSIPTSLAFNSDGTKMFVLGSQAKDVNEYILSTGFDVSTATYSKNFSVAAQDTQPYGLAFNTDGTKMFIVGAVGDDVYEYRLSTGFDVSTAAYSQNFSISSVDTTPYGIAFNTDGTKMFIVSFSADDVKEYILASAAIPTGYQPVHTTASIDSTYWTDINSMTADQAAGDGNVYYAISTDDRTTWTVIDNTDGERDIVRNNAGTWQYNSNGTYASETWTNATTNTELAALAEAMEGAVAGYNINNASFVDSFSVASQETAPRQLAFNTDGTKMFVVGSTGDDINEYTLSTGFDVSTSSFVDSFSVAAQETDPNGIAFNTDGTKMFITGNVGDDVNEYTLSTGFDVSTASFVDSFGVSSQDTTPRAIAFNSDGTKMFIAGDSNNAVYEYTLSTGFDVSTASYVDNFSVSGQTTTPYGLEFNADGTKMFVLGLSDGAVFQYTLSTGFDVSTASFVNSFSVASQDNTPTGLAFSSNGSKMFVTGTSGQDINEYITASYTNQMDKTQLDAVTDPNHIALGNDLDLSIIFNMTSGTTVPSSDGVAINYDANVLNKGAVLGTDYDFDFPATDKVRITALADNNLKVRVV